MGEDLVGAAPVVVPLPDEIDVNNSDQVFSTLTAAFLPGVSMVIADMTSTIFCDTSGVRTLVTAHQQAVELGMGLRFAIPEGGSVRRVLGLTGVIRVLPVYTDVNEAGGGG